MSFRVSRAGRAALAALRAGPARVFAVFERSCYVETSAGLACLGGPGLGQGPLNAILEGFEVPAIGTDVEFELSQVEIWQPMSAGVASSFPHVGIPESIKPEARAFLSWFQGGTSRAPDRLIGLGPGLTPAGDDFVGGAMIALRACGDARAADRIAAWALPLAQERTNRISRAHLECAASGEGHEALHDYLASGDREHLDRLTRIGHTSGLDAAAGALLALQWRPPLRRRTRPQRSATSS